MYTYIICGDYGEDIELLMFSEFKRESLCVMLEKVVRVDEHVRMIKMLFIFEELNFTVFHCISIYTCIYSS